MTYPHFTILLSTENLTSLQNDKDSCYKVLMTKDCYYCGIGEYKIAEISLLDDDEDTYDFETILNVTGSLLLHEDGSNCFCILEEDLPRLTDLFDWSGSGEILMGEMLSVEEKIILLKEKAENKPIYINTGNKDHPVWEPLAPGKFVAIETLFASSGDNIKFGVDEIESIWWPHLIEDKGYSYIIQKEQPKSKKWTDEDYKNYYSETEYEYNYNIPAWYRDYD